MGLNWNFQRGGGIQTKNLLWEGYKWIFSGATHLSCLFELKSFLITQSDNKHYLAILFFFKLFKNAFCKIVIIARIAMIL